MDYDDPPHVKGQPRDSVEILIDHAHRMWESERENADRIAQRSQLVAGGTIALLGLGLFGFNWLYEVPSKPMLPSWLVPFMHLFLLIALGCFVRSLVVLFMTRGGKNGTATEQLEILEADTGRPIRRLVLKKVHAAYYELKERNAGAWVRLELAQEWFSYGLALVLLTLLCYLLGSLPAKMFPEDHANGHGDNGYLPAQSVEVRASEAAGRDRPGDRSPDDGEPREGAGDPEQAAPLHGDGAP